MSEFAAAAAEGLAARGVLTEKAAFDDATREITRNQLSFKDQLGLQDSRLHELAGRETVATTTWREIPHQPEQECAFDDLAARASTVTRELIDIDSARNNEFAPLMEAAKTKDRKVRVQLPIALSICELTRQDLSEFLPRRAQVIDRYQEAVEALESFAPPTAQP
jgi:hypothetical protein